MSRFSLFLSCFTFLTVILLSKEFEVIEDGVHTSAVVAPPQKKSRKEYARQPSPVVSTISTQERAETEANTSFVISLTPKLRKEVLLTADEVFLSTLPEFLILEARQLQKWQKSEMKRNRQLKSCFVMEREEKVKRRNHLRIVKDSSNNGQFLGQEQIGEIEEECQHHHQQQCTVAGSIKLSEFLPLLCNESESAEHFLISRGLYTTAKNLFNEVLRH